MKKPTKTDHLDQGECSVVKALAIIGGKWKLPLIKRLTVGTKRYNELFRELEGITQRMLTKQLRELENDNIVARKVYPEIPPKVEYSLTQGGKDLQKVISELEKWGGSHAGHR
jgi:DNA-binding HxlR family transcriptional regulator